MQHERLADEQERIVLDPIFSSPELAQINLFELVCQPMVSTYV